MIFEILIKIRISRWEVDRHKFDFYTLEKRIYVYLVTCFQMLSIIYYRILKICDWSFNFYYESYH